MLVISWIYVTFSLLSLVSGIYILSLNSKNRINILFSLICFDLMIIFFLENFFNYTSNKELAIILYYVILFFTNLFFPLNIQFLYELTKEKKIKLILFFIIYIPSLLMTFFSITFHFPWSDFIRINNQFWKLISAVNNPGFYFYIAYGYIYFGISLFLLYFWKKKSELIKIKRQATILMSGLLFFLISGFISNLVLQAIPSYKMPMLSILNVSVYLFSILYSLLKYKFLSMDNKLVLDEVLSCIDEYVFLLDIDLNIIQASNISKRLFLNSNFKLSFLDIIDQNKYLNNVFKELIKGNIAKSNALIFYKKNKELLITDSYITRIEDKFKDILAILVISRKNKVFRDFKKNDKITNRELEIIYLTILGFSNKDIADKLELSARTIDSHQIHVYDKLNINNKMDLIKLVNIKN